jgi:hypothetical protein
MGKYSQIISDVFSVFDSVAWKDLKLKTIPTDFIEVPKPGAPTVEEFVRVDVVASGSGVNIVSGSGVVIVDIFTKAGLGPARKNIIADILDSYLVGKTLKTVAGKNVQFFGSTLAKGQGDKDNPSLNRASYTIPFNYNEVLQ